MDEAQEKRELIQQMGSRNNKIALAAVEKLRERDWLLDGSLVDVNLSDANLHGANLSDADLSFADLRRASLREANLFHTSLSDANLRHADLGFVNLSHADLHGADFTNAFCWDAVFANVDLSEVKGLETVEHGGPSEISISTLYLSKGKIPEAFLRGCGVPEDLITYLPSLMGQAIDFYSCFISYSRQDQAFTDQLAGRMRDNKLRVWYAPEDMKGGEKIHEQIDIAIKYHDKLILVLSPHSINSAWVQREVRSAVKREQEENRRVLFPIRLVSYEALQDWKLWDGDMVLDLAKEIREYFIPDFSNWKDYDSFSAGFERLLADLRKSEE